MNERYPYGQMKESSMRGVTIAICGNNTCVGGSCASSKLLAAVNSCGFESFSLDDSTVRCPSGVSMRIPRMDDLCLRATISAPTSQKVLFDECASNVCVGGSCDCSNLLTIFMIVKPFNLEFLTVQSVAS